MKKKILLSLFALLILKLGNTQVAVGVYPYPFSLVEVSTNPENRIFGSLRIQTNSFIGPIYTDWSFHYNFKRGDVLNTYGFTGIRVSPFASVHDGPLLDGFYLGAGLRIKPFKEVKQLAIIAEVAPLVNEEFASARIISNFGISWNFIRKKD